MTTALETYRRTITEAAMQDAIQEIVTLKGGKLWHLRDARKAPELTDLTDLIIVVPGFASLVEVKSQRRIVTPGQMDVAALLATVTRFWGGVVRPMPREGELSYDEFVAMLEAA